MHACLQELHKAFGAGTTPNNQYILEHTPFGIQAFSKIIEL